MKTTVKKSFLDIHKEEEWLNEQGQNGLMLTHYHGGEYEFENVSPAKYQYKIDLPAYTGSKKKEYFAFLEQTGISVVAEYGGRVYLRKKTRLMISGIIFFILGIRKHREYGMPKEDKDIWE